MRITTIAECRNFGKAGTATYRFETTMPFMPIPGTKLMIGNVELTMADNVITWDNDESVCYIVYNRYGLSRLKLAEEHADFIEAGWRVLSKTGVLV